VAKSETPATEAAAPAPASLKPAEPAAAPAAMANTAVATATGTDLVWTPAAQWTVKPASAMRKGSYAVPGEGGAVADLSVTAFPGTVGGEVANVNRWRGQIQLPPWSEAEVTAGVTRFNVNGLAVTLVEFGNPSAAPAQRLLGAMVPFGGATWFFKLLGPDALVAREKPVFVEFLKTVKPAAFAP
jgi:hypothetical protein